MIQTIEKYPILTIIITVLMIFIIHLGVMNITIMEARNFITAREMVETGEWFLTTMNGEARYQKPPLPTWLTAISGLIFGMKSLWALRLPSALMVLILGVYVFKFSNYILKNKSHSLINALICITSLYVIIIINEAPWDIYTHTFMLIGIYYFYKLSTENNFFYKYTLFAGLFTGLSILCKGPVSLYVLFLPFLISFGIVFKFQNIKRRVIPFILFILISFIIGASWYLYIRYADTETFLAIAEKETSNWTSYNVRPFYYYWSFFIQSGIWTIPAFISLLYPYLKSKVQNLKGYQFSLLWTAIAVVLLSIIPEKKSRYLMPVLIPLAINTGFYIQYLIQNFKSITSKKESIPVYIIFGLIALIALVIPEVIYFGLEGFPKHSIYFGLLTITTMLIGFKIFNFLKNKNIKAVFYSVIGFVIVLFLFGMPISSEFVSNNKFHSIKNIHKMNELKDLKTYAFNDLTPEFLWEYEGKITVLNAQNFKTPSENNFGILVQNEDVIDMKELLQNYDLEYLKTFNQNVGKKRERLVRKLFLVKKK